MRCQNKKVKITQTDPDVNKTGPEEKLKKIVSFSDKMVNTDQVLAGIKNKRLVIFCPILRPILDFYKD